MRFMILVKASKESEAGQMPSAELLTAMGKYNEELVKAGILLAGDGLQPSAKGARVTFNGSQRVVVDGPFAETKELLAGYWILQVKSRDEALAWVRRIPFTSGEVVEVRQVFETADFADVMPLEAAAREEALRAELKKKTARL